MRARGSGLLGPRVSAVGLGVKLRLYVAEVVYHRGLKFRVKLRLYVAEVAYHIGFRI